MLLQSKVRWPSKDWWFPNQSNLFCASFQFCWWLFAFGCCMTKEAAGPQGQTAFGGLCTLELV